MMQSPRVRSSKRKVTKQSFPNLAYHQNHMEEVLLVDSWAQPKNLLYLVYYGGSQEPTNITCPSSR